MVLPIFHLFLDNGSVAQRRSEAKTGCRRVVRACDVP